jgi:hypothetical protein
MKTAIEWLEEQMETWGHFPRWMRDDIVKKAKEHRLRLNSLTRS